MTTTTAATTSTTPTPPQRFPNRGIGSANFEPPRRDIDIERNRDLAQVDEFGNPLGEVHNTDTTRYELGSGGDPTEQKCPRNWVRFKLSCYKFTRSPPKKWGDARELCRAFRHDDQDKADLASVDSFEEHR